MRVTGPQPDFDDCAWETARIRGRAGVGPLRPRGIPRLRESQVGPFTLLEHCRAEPGAQAARWIWTREPDYPAQRAPRWSAPEGERFFRRHLELPEGASNVVIWATADNELDCYFNGRKVGENHGDIGSWMTLQRMDVTAEVKAGAQWDRHPGDQQTLRHGIRSSRPPGRRDLAGRRPTWTAGLR